MHPDSLHIRSEANGKEYYCQWIHLKGSAPMGGNLECPEMFELPPPGDRVFTVTPIGFRIELTGYNREPKQPSFRVLL